MVVYTVLGGHSLQIAEAKSGDKNTQLPGSLKDGAAVFNRNDPVVALACNGVFLLYIEIVLNAKYCNLLIIF